MQIKKVNRDNSIKIYNTLSRKIEKFRPIFPPKVGMYACGPTVYGATHIGHMSKYIGDDILKRALTLNGYRVTHVMNITDVGHLTSDEDEGEDKIEKGAKKEGLSVWEIAKKYEDQFFAAMDTLKVIKPDITPRATEHIGDQLELIKKLEAKGYTYETKSAIYFDISKFPNYNKLSGQRLEDKKTAAREDVVKDPEKKSPYDFVLWFKNVGKFKSHIMIWSSPWGDGFPGWHIECSAMSMKYLGERLDIHTGGIDHIGVHHPAEIAQSESATGKKFVKYWIHRAFIMVDGKKMSKSLSNIYTLTDITERGFDPLALRYLFLTSHYRTSMNFTWESLEGAEIALRNLRNKISAFVESRKSTSMINEKIYLEYKQRFLSQINDDLNTAQAVALLWEVVDSKMSSNTKISLVGYFDKVFGLDLVNATKNTEVKKIDPELKKLVAERELYRSNSEYGKADEVRKKIENLGYILEDTPKGVKLKQTESDFIAYRNTQK